MLAPQTISVHLNNALRATPLLAELDREAPLPEVISEMPEQIHGHFVALDSGQSHEMETAWKRVVIFNATQVLYSFQYDPATAEFNAQKR
jgi:hypothetical protein